jgi:uncharacterized protein YabN with tetrapyrrole methylase and pyrophosphatase domain
MNADHTKRLTNNTVNFVCLICANNNLYKKFELKLNFISISPKPRGLGWIKMQLQTFQKKMQVQNNKKAGTSSENLEAAKQQQEVALQIRAKKDFGTVPRYY